MLAVPLGGQPVTAHREVSCCLTVLLCTPSTRTHRRHHESLWLVCGLLYYTSILSCSCLYRARPTRRMDQQRRRRFEYIRGVVRRVQWHNLIVCWSTRASVVDTAHKSTLSVAARASPRRMIYASFDHHSPLQQTEETTALESFKKEAWHQPFIPVRLSSSSTPCRDYIAFARRHYYLVLPQTEMRQ